MKDHEKHPRAIPLEGLEKPGPRKPAPDTPAPLRAPRAFDLTGGTEASGRRAKVEITEALEPEVDAIAAPAPLPRQPGFFSFSSLVWTAFWLLTAIYLGDAAWGFLLSLEAKSPWIAQAALGLAGVVAFGLLVFLGREFLAIFRMRKVASLRERAAAWLAAPDKGGARELVADLRGFYARDPTSAAGRAEVDLALGELHDPKTLLVITERALLKPKDDAARRAIATASQRVSVVTALSPRAIVDLLFVLAQSVRLIRELSGIYGGRASGFGLLRLAARVASHLAVTGGMAVADSVFSQIIGAGLAARLSAKLGEGVLNGVLTARVGIAALDLCRPLPFIECEPIILSRVVSNTLIPDKVAENPAG